ncbi:MAG: indolepyruvate ferredoxin oxidoreductase subunit alpha [Methanosarcinaceae archaeon]|nr:indolepyruvate ferredoxin oxidoreductase subunit alpha [Methanosarcinaceae archaeon]
MTSTTIISGLEALYLAAVDSSVELVTAVAGYPITNVMERFLRNGGDTGIDARWMTNEKAALETALGASVSGRRALVLSKHVGMNVLADPLVTSATHTIGAGLVIFAGDDPGVAASQNEQDSRWYGSLAEIAVFDPATPEDAYRAVIRGFELSESIRAPVIVRITSRLETGEGEVERIESGKSGKQKAVFDRSIWELTMLGKHQRYHLKSYPVLVDEAEHTPLNRLNIGGHGQDVGIISSGYPSALVDGVLETDGRWGGVSHLALNMVNPLPFDKLREFLKRHRHVLVVEETEPFIESHLCVLDNVLGKRTGHMPYGQVDVEHIEYALEHIHEDSVVKYTDIQTIKSRGPRSLCDDCPYIPLYHILHDMDVPIAGDIGCSVRSGPEPLSAIDTSFALGSAVTVACGFDRKGIAVIGDFGMAHSGIVGLVNAVYCGFDVLVIVLKNRVAAMTGGQDAPDLTDVVRTLVGNVSVFDIDSSPSDDLKHLIEKKLGERGVSVIYVEGKCRKY